MRTGRRMRGRIGWFTSSASLLLQVEGIHDSNYDGVGDPCMCQVLCHLQPLSHADRDIFLHPCWYAHPPRGYLYVADKIHFSFSPANIWIPLSNRHIRKRCFPCVFILLYERPSQNPYKKLKLNNFGDNRCEGVRKSVSFPRLDDL